MNLIQIIINGYCSFTLMNTWINVAAKIFHKWWESSTVISMFGSDGSWWGTSQSVNDGTGRLRFGPGTQLKIHKSKIIIIIIKQHEPDMKQSFYIKLNKNLQTSGKIKVLMQIKMDQILIPVFILQKFIISYIFNQKINKN